MGRPLSLVVVDEAHTIQSANRGLKLELLLATINKECVRAQFLLLTPFIQNARETLSFAFICTSLALPCAAESRCHGRCCLLHRKEDHPLAAFVDPCLHPAHSVV